MNGSVHENFEGVIKQVATNVLPSEKFYIGRTQENKFIVLSGLSKANVTTGGVSFLTMKEIKSHTEKVVRDTFSQLQGSGESDLTAKAAHDFLDKMKGRISMHRPSWWQFITKYILNSFSETIASLKGLVAPSLKDELCKEVDGVSLTNDLLEWITNNKLMLRSCELKKI